MFFVVGVDVSSKHPVSDYFSPALRGMDWYAMRIVLTVVNCLCYAQVNY